MPPSPPGPAFRHSNFRYYILARVLTTTASEMQAVAVAWQVYSLTHRPLDLGLVGLAQFLPGILLFLVAGQTADRFARQRILQACCAGFALCSLLLLGLRWHGFSSILPIYGVLLANGLIPEQPRVRLAHHVVKQRFAVFPFYLLVLQRHRVLYRLPALTRELARPVAYHGLQRLVRHESIDKGAVERLGHTPQGRQFDRAFTFGLLYGDNRRLLYAQTFCQLRRGHAERLPDGFDPSTDGRIVARDGPQLPEARIQMRARLGGKAGLIHRLWPIDIFSKNRF
jgi:Transmembrane secretion effector